MMLFEIAYHRKMSIDDLLDITYSELIKWHEYFRRRPIGWRDDDRAYKYLQTQGVKERPGRIFSSLGVMYGGDDDKSDEINSVKGLKSSFLYNKMLSAKGGKKLNES